MILVQEDLYIKSNRVELPDRDKLVVSQNEYFPVMNDCRLGRYKLKQNWIELLDKDKIVVNKNEYSPAWNDCRLGRYKYHNEIIKYFQ